MKPDVGELLLVAVERKYRSSFKRVSHFLNWSQTGRPVIIQDVGSLMGSLVGETERLTRQALRIIDAMQPEIVVLDEIDKAFAGVSGSGQSVSGVSARIFGSFPSWLNDRESDKFVVCTSNDVGELPPEFARAERFDSVFFLDFPSRQEEDAIWDLYISQYQLDAYQRRSRDLQWTVAEIKACCRLSALVNVPRCWMYRYRKHRRMWSPSQQRLVNRSNGCEPGPAGAISTRPLAVFTREAKRNDVGPSTRSVRRRRQINLRS